MLTGGGFKHAPGKQKPPVSRVPGAAFCEDVEMDELSQTRTAMAVLFVALVKALNEKNEGLTHSFLKHLDEAYSDLRETGVDPAVNDILSWTKESLQSDEDLGQPAWVVYGKGPGPRATPTVERTGGDGNADRGSWLLEQAARARAPHCNDRNRERPPF